LDNFINYTAFFIQSSYVFGRDITLSITIIEQLTIEKNRQVSKIFFSYFYTY